MYCCGQEDKNLKVPPDQWIWVKMHVIVHVCLNIMWYFLLKFITELFCIQQTHYFDKFIELGMWVDFWNDSLCTFLGSAGTQSSLSWVFQIQIPTSFHPWMIDVHLWIYYSWLSLNCSSCPWQQSLDLVSPSAQKWPLWFMQIRQFCLIIMMSCILALRMWCF